nr:NAAT family transporter [bacterium]
MHPLVWDFLIITTSLFTLVNPIGSVPVFISLAEDLTKSGIKSVARRGTLTAFVILVVFALLGKYIFEIYSITTYAFRIVGGVLFFKVGFDLLHARTSRTKNTPKEEEEASQKEDFGISPLGIPMLAGPGSITAV